MNSNESNTFRTNTQTMVCMEKWEDNDGASYSALLTAIKAGISIDMRGHTTYKTCTQEEKRLLPNLA